jgi:type II secretory pathway component GspD/PulD (secretin)
MSMIKSIAGFSRKYLILSLCGIIFITLIAAPCFGVQTGHSEPVFSLVVKNQSLNKVLNTISKSSGYTITVSSEWENRQVTAHLEGVTLEQGLKKIIRLMGNPNHVIISNEKEKRIDIKIYDTEPDYSKGMRTSSIEDPLDMEVIPPEKEGGRGITVRELQAMQTEQRDPLDMEVIPPDKEGGRGITERELQAMQTENISLDPSDDVLPPNDLR